jgi:hypothetical protein
VYHVNRRASAGSVASLEAPCHAQRVHVREGLNPCVCDLRICGLAWAWKRISAGQRHGSVSEGGLEPGNAGISPVRGNFHGTRITADARRRQAFRVASCFPAGRRAMSGAGRSGPLGRRSGGHGPCCPQSPGSRNIRLMRSRRACGTGQIRRADRNVLAVACLPGVFVYGLGCPRSGSGAGGSKLTSTRSKPLMRWALAWRE